MISKYRNYDVFEQDYLEELIRQTLPNCKINNVIPHNGVSGDTVVNPCPVQDNVLYYGSFGKVGSGAPKVKTLYGDTCTYGVDALSISAPVLCFGLDTAVSGCYFSGWKIMIENPPVNPFTPAPPIALDVDGVKVWNFTDVTTDYTYNAIALFGAVNANSTFEYKKASDVSYKSTPLVKGSFRFKLLLDDSVGVSIQEALQWRVKDSFGNVIHSGTTVFNEIPYLPETVSADATFEYIDLTAMSADFVRPGNIRCFNAGGADVGSPFVYNTALRYRLLKSTVPVTFDIGFTFGYKFTLVDGSQITRTTPDLMKKYGITKVV